jgi:hypothetical protein
VMAQFCRTGDPRRVALRRCGLFSLRRWIFYFDELASPYFK